MAELTLSIPHLFLELDTPRPICVEKSYTHTRTASQITNIDNGQLSRVYKWATGSVTLKPINLTIDFVETNKYEALKFRLSADPNHTEQTHFVNVQQQGGPWFSEVPMNTHYQGAPCDFFFNCVVSQANAGSVGASGSLVNQLLTLLAYDSAQSLANAYNFAQQNGLSVMQSQETFPQNQGYRIRFFFHVRSGQSRSGVLQFIFGDFCLWINNDGTADIYQTADYQNWRLWESFRYAVDGSSSREISITIFPHGKNKIEFACHSIEHIVGSSSRVGTRSSQDVVHEGSHIFTCPWNTRAPNGTYLITASGQWGMIVSKEIRPLFQVSLLGFYDGTANPAIFYDDLQDIGYPPTTWPTQVAVFDANDGIGSNFAGGSGNGGTLGLSLMTFPYGQWPVPIAEPFRIKSHDYAGDQFYSVLVQMQGQGDVPLGIAGIANCSSITPEFYSYCVDKPPVFVPSPLAPVQFPVMHVDIDTGSSLENKHLQVTLNNQDGQLEDYKYRGHIPCRLIDTLLDIILFEGNWYDPESFENVNDVRHVRATIRSMADEMLREYPDNLDFTINTDAPNGNAWTWQAVAQRCAEESGISPYSIIFEGTGPTGDTDNPWAIPGNEYDFPLWNAIDAGGATTGGTKSDEKQDVSRWKPKPTTPIYQFFDSLVRSTMGWHFDWSTADSTLRVYKRPQPKEVLFDNAKAAFFSTFGAMTAWLIENPGTEVSCYLHTGISYTTERPDFTTLRCQGFISTYGLKDRSELQKLLQANQIDGTQIGDSAYSTASRFISHDFDNPNGYIHSDGTYTIGPDFLVNKKVRKLNLTAAGSLEAFRWFARRFFEDLCYGHKYANFESDCCDLGTYALRKYDLILIDPDPSDDTTGWFYFERVEPQWGGGSLRRGRYRAIEYRTDAPPPR